MYERRRYRVVGGRLEKSWKAQTEEEGWYTTKTAAWDAVKPKPEPVKRKPGRPRKHPLPQFAPEPEAS